MPKRLPGVPPAALDAAPGGAVAVDRALMLLGSFRTGDGSLSLAELAQRTGLHKSTALRLIASLAHRGFLGRLPDGRYALSSEIARLHGVYAASFSLERVVLPVLAQLVQQTGESAAFHVMQMQREHPVRLCLFRVDSPHPVRDHIKAGDILPGDRGTGARVLHAFNPELAARADPQGQALLQAIRHAGYYASTGDRLTEVAGISAPVFRGGRTIAAALTLTMPAHRFDQRHVQPVVEAASRLSAAIPE